MTTSLDQFSKAVAAVVAAAAPSVVGVGRTGSGVVVGDGLIVTNAHNLRPEIVVFFEDGRALDAEIAGVDLEGDLAVLSADTGGAHPWRGQRMGPRSERSWWGCPARAARA